MEIKTKNVLKNGQRLLTFEETLEVAHGRWESARRELCERW